MNKSHLAGIFFFTPVDFAIETLIYKKKINIHTTYWLFLAITKQGIISKLTAFNIIATPPTARPGGAQDRYSTL